MRTRWPAIIDGCCLALIGILWGCSSHEQVASGATPATQKDSMPTSWSSVSDQADGRSDVQREMQGMFDAGLKRRLETIGQEAPLPSSYEYYFLDHLADAVVFLKTKLQSNDPTEQANAIDFAALIPDIPSIHDLVIQTNMEVLFHGALMRPFGAGGPVFALSSSCRDYFRAHADMARAFLSTKLKSTDSNVQINALDFVTQIADVASVHDWAMEVMHNAMTDGLIEENTVEATYRRLLKEDTTTRPSN